MLLLITGCINVNDKVPYLKLKDTNIRLLHYLRTLKWAANQNIFSEIVFCENSNYNYNFHKYIAKINPNIKFEYLTFTGNTKMSIMYGKGYGEGEIIKYALEHSQLLKNCQWFCKITGKLIVRNLKVLKIDRNCNQFMKYKYSNQIDTRFFIVNKNDYVTYLMQEFKLVNDRKTHFLEHCYYEALQKHKIPFQCFNRLPIIDGYSGSVGKRYDTAHYKKVDDLLCSFHLYNSNGIRALRLYGIHKLKLIKKELVIKEYDFIERDTTI